MATERLSNSGYLLIGKQTTSAPVVPSIGVPLYDESMATNGDINDINPIVGQNFSTLTSLPGQRSFKGDLTVMAEGNTMAHFFNAFATQGSSTNAGGVYTYPYTHGSTNAQYTADVSLGNMVKRYWGMQISKVSPVWSKNEMRAKLAASAIGSFEGREITSISGSGPYTVTLNDPNGVFDGSPTTGLVVGDLIRFYDTSAATTIDATVASIPNGTTFTTSTNPTAITAGDSVYLRPQTPTMNNLAPFLWSKTKVCFGTTASAALSATPTPVEQGSTWELVHKFNNDDGEMRSGAHTPASLARTVYDANVKIKKICDNSDDVVAFNNLNKSAVVFRHYAGATNQYELRVTFNHVKTDGTTGNIKTGDLVYLEENLHVNYDTTDSQAFDAKVLCALTTV